MEPTIADSELTGARIQRGGVHDRSGLVQYTVAARFGAPDHASDVTILVVVPAQPDKTASRAQAIAAAKNAAQLFSEIEAAYFQPEEAG
jgi:hypothetical protein